MATPRPLSHFSFMLTTEGERAIHLAVGPYAPDQNPHLVVTIRPDQTVTFVHGVALPTLSLADLELVVSLAADYSAARQWLESAGVAFTGNWYPLPATATALLADWTDSIVNDNRLKPSEKIVRLLPPIRVPRQPPYPLNDHPYA